MERCPPGDCSSSASAVPMSYQLYRRAPWKVSFDSQYHACFAENCKSRRAGLLSSIARMGKVAGLERVFGRASVSWPISGSLRSGFRTVLLPITPLIASRTRPSCTDPTTWRSPNHNIFVEMGEPARLVIDRVVPPKFGITATFEDQGPQTRLTFRPTFESADAFESVKRFAAPGGRQTIEELTRCRAAGVAGGCRCRIAIWRRCFRPYPLYGLVDAEGRIADELRGAGGARALRNLLRKAGLE